MKVIQTKVSDEEFEALKKIAESKGESIYQYLRNLVLRELKKEGNIVSGRLPLHARVEDIEERLQLLEEKVSMLQEELHSLKRKLQEMQERLENAGLSKWFNTRGVKK